MCLAIPALVVLVGENRMAQVDIHGVTRTVSLDLVPDAGVDDWVLVHAGYAIEVVDAQFAAESWELILEMGEALDAEEAALIETRASAAASTADPAPAGGA
jgi:hydrogenase expression/formation protein HypC